MQELFFGLMNFLKGLIPTSGKDENRLEALVKKDDVKAIKNTLKNAESQNLESTKLTLLEWSCKLGAPKIAEYLLSEEKVPADQPDEKTKKTGLTLLMDLILKNSERALAKKMSWDTTARLVELLASHGADCNVKMNGKAALWQACRRTYQPEGSEKETKIPDLEVAPNAIRLAKALLEHGADAKVTCRDQSILELIICYETESLTPPKENADLVELLLKHGANPNQEKTFFLHKAASNGHFKTAKALVEHKAEINAQDKNKQTPLHRAMASGNEDLILFLIENGADLNAKDDQENLPHNFYHVKDIKKAENILSKLKEKGVDLNYESKVERSRTGLLVKALEDGIDSLKRCQLLVDKIGLDVKGGSNSKKPPILAASGNGDIETMTFLLEKGADPNASAHSLGYDGGLTPIEAIIRNSNLKDDKKKKSIQLLLDKGATSTDKIQNFLDGKTDKEEKD